MVSEKIKEVREKSLEQLYKDLKTLNKELRELRFKVFSREIKDTTKKKTARRKIARIMTVIREKEYNKIINTSEPGKINP